MDTNTAPITTAADVAATVGCSIDDALILGMATVDVLRAAAAGRIDLNALARDELANRGLDLAGKWVGFDRAREAVTRVECPVPRPVPGQ